MSASNSEQRAQGRGLSIGDVDEVGATDAHCLGLTTIYCRGLDTYRASCLRNSRAGRLRRRGSLLSSRCGLRLIILCQHKYRSLSRTIPDLRLRLRCVRVVDLSRNSLRARLDANTGACRLVSRFVTSSGVIWSRFIVSGLEIRCICVALV